MSTYRELIYIILDKVKESTDDSFFKEEHIAFLLDKYRPFLLKQRYADVRKSISQNNYSLLSMNIELQGNNFSPAANLASYTTNGIIYKTTTTVPRLVSFNDYIEEFKVLVNSSSDPYNQFVGDFSIVSPERFKFAGEKEWLKKFVYVTIGADYYLYLKVNDSDLILPNEVLLQGIIENPKKEVSRILPIVSSYLDMQYPLEDALVPPLLELVVKDIADGVYRPEDTINNATDDLGKVGTKTVQQR